MKQRVITVPKDKDAERALYYDEAMDNQLIEFFLNEDEFMLMWNNGIFDAINEISNSMIDDYEDDCITNPELLKKVLDDLQITRKKSDGQLIDILKKLEVLFKEAISRETGVYFYF